MKRITVYYHANCPDGFSGAWAAWKKFGNAARYIPFEHNAPVPGGIDGIDVFFIDILPGIRQLKTILSRAGTVTAIDHHETNRPLVRLISRRSFNLRRSGAVLAWQFFHPRKAVPKLLRYVEDVDLWRLRLPHAKEVAAALELADFNFKTWDALARDFKTQKRFRSYVNRGTIILEYQRRMVGRILNGSVPGKLGTTNVRIVNSPILERELGNALSRHGAPAGLVWSEQKKIIKVSLRSAGKTNVGKLAARYGGGGHRFAAGFRLPRGTPFPWKYEGRK